MLRNEDSSVESAQLDYDIDLEWKSGAAVTLDFQISEESRGRIRNKRSFYSCKLLSDKIFFFPGCNVFEKKCVFNNSFIL